MEDLPDELFQSETLDSKSAPGSSAMLCVPEGLTPLMQVYTRFALAREFDLQGGFSAEFASKIKALFDQHAFS
jgi:hypothetical protein